MNDEGCAVGNVLARRILDVAFERVGVGRGAFGSREQIDGNSAVSIERLGLLRQRRLRWPPGRLRARHVSHRVPGIGIAFADAGGGLCVRSGGRTPHRPRAAGRRTGTSLRRRRAASRPAPPGAPSSVASTRKSGAGTPRRETIRPPFRCSSVFDSGASGDEYWPSAALAGTGQVPIGAAPADRRRRCVIGSLPRLSRTHDVSSVFAATIRAGRHRRRAARPSREPHRPACRRRDR